MKIRNLFAIVVMLALLLGGGARAFALTVNMRPAAGQVAPSTVTQVDQSVVSPDANGNFAITQVLTVSNLMSQGWIISVPATSVNILGNVTAGTVNLDLSKGCFVTETLTGNITHTFTNAAYCKGEQVCVNTIQDGTGGRSITWTGFTGLTPPQPNQAIGGADLICFADNATQVIYPTTGQNQTLSGVTLAGSVSGTYALAPAATTTSYTETAKAVVPAQGDILDYSNGTGQRSSLVDVAVGSVVISGGVGAVPTYSATPSVTSVTASGAGIDKAINASNGGHISNPLGTGTLPTVGTGTVTAGGTDSAMEITGATSPATVTFHTAFAVAPICGCTNESTAAHGCAVGSTGTTSTIVTTAGTDSFTLICIGK